MFGTATNKCRFYTRSRALIRTNASKHLIQEAHLWNHLSGQPYDHERGLSAQLVNWLSPFRQPILWEAAGGWDTPSRALQVR
jgi:hypothetical protein